MNFSQHHSQSGIEDAQQALESHMYRVADKIFDYLEGEEQHQMLEKCKQSMANICSAEIKFRGQQKLVQAAAQRYREHNGERSVKEILSELKENAPHSTEDTENHKSYQTLMKVINDGDNRVNRGGQPDGDEDEDEELQLTEMTVNTLDPFTKREMTDPVMSSKCRHTYERTSVMALLKDKSSIRCPTPGCGWISVDDLVPNLEMKRIIEERLTNQD